MNLTQFDLAEQAGLSLKYIGEIERASGKNPRLQTIERICDVIGWKPFAERRDPSAERRAETEARIQELLGAAEKWLIKVGVLTGAASQPTVASSTPLRRAPRSSDRRRHNRKY